MYLVLLLLCDFCWPNFLNFSQFDLADYFSRKWRTKKFAMAGYNSLTLPKTLVAKKRLKFKSQFFLYSMVVEMLNDMYFGLALFFSTICLR